MGSLTTKLTETFVGDNGKEVTTTTLTLSNISYIDKRIMSISTTEQTIADFRTVEEGGTYAVADVRYLRITNLDATNFVLLRFKNQSGMQFLLKLDVGQTFYFNGDIASGLVDIFSASQNTASTLHDLWEIEAEADTDPIKLELYVATVA